MDYQFKVYQTEVANIQDPRRIFINWIKSESKVLDVGCAAGNFGFELKKEKNCQVWGIDYNPESIALAKKTNSYVKIDLTDLNQIDEEFINKYLNFFDYIVLGDVLEHLLNPDITIDKLKQTLNNTGRILISVPNIAHCSIKARLILNEFEYEEAGLMDSSHIHFFTYKSLAVFLNKHNLKIINYSYTTWADIYNGQKENNPYNKISSCVKYSILNDKHSHVTQYVVECEQDSSIKESEYNLKLIDDNTKENKNWKYTYKIKRELKRITNKILGKTK